MSDKLNPQEQGFYRFAFGYQKNRITERLLRWKEQEFLKKLWKKDPALWSAEPVPEIIDRMGWLFLPESMEEKLPGLMEMAEEIKHEGVSHVVLIGMGGSSLAPEMFQSIFGNAEGCPKLVVLDSTHPAAIASLREALDIKRTFFLISSKSGTTLETISLFKYFWKLVGESTSYPGRWFAAITDSASPLDKTAEERGFRFNFRAAADVGGRYSVFTEFGLVPAALIGVDIAKLLAQAKKAADENMFSQSEDLAPGLRIGAAFGEVGLEQNKFTILTSHSIRAFADWLEQLVAESTGKNGKGILPVVNEPLTSPCDYSEDRIFYYARLEKDEDHGEQVLVEALIKRGLPVIECVYKDLFDLGYDIFNWQLAVSAASSILGIHPFNQPDVGRSKDLTRTIMSEGIEGKDTQEHTIFQDDPQIMAGALLKYMEKEKKYDYIGIQAYLAPSKEVLFALKEFRQELFQKTGTVTTLGIGPRFLHSTGQIHKGGPRTGFFIQLVDEPESDLSVPETGFTFKSLLEAQSRGDYLALKQSGQQIFRINLQENIQEGLLALKKLIRCF